MGRALPGRQVHGDGSVGEIIQNRLCLVCLSQPYQSFLFLLLLLNISPLTDTTPTS
jgi:hypothetical protein